MTQEKPKAQTSAERQQKWLAKDGNLEKRNAARAKHRAETEPKVLYSTLVKYGLDLTEINTVRKTNKLPPIEVPEAPSPMNTAALALALQYKRRADQAVEEAGQIERKAEKQVTTTQEALVRMAEKQDVPQLIGPDLSFDQLRSWYKYWFSPFDEYGNTLIDPEYEGEEKEYRFQHYPEGDLEESNFKEYLGLQGFKTEGGRVSGQMGEIWNNLVKMGCKTRSENIIPCLKQRNRQGELVLLKTLTDNLTYTLKDGTVVEYSVAAITKYLQAIVWLFDTFPFVKPKFMTLSERNKIRTEIRTMYLGYAAKNRGTEVIPDVEPFTELLKRVEKKYGTASPENLFMHLFQVVPVRDNFGKLKIVTEEPTEEELRKLQQQKHENLIYVPKRGDIIMYLVNYKTRNLYGTQVIRFTKPTVNAAQGMSATLATQLGKQFAAVSGLIRDQIKTNPNQPYLFMKYDSKTNKYSLYGGQKLAKGLITPMLTAIKATGSAKGLGINFLRHSFVTEFFKGKANDPANVARSKRMLHSPVMHEKYVYELKLDDKDPSDLSKIAKKEGLKIDD
jgi:hypothetical protein